MSKLQIYKSSAGSGKTFHLTANYLKLLLIENVSHRNILAVTFTNKASGEMKSRILETLYQLSVADENASKTAKSLFPDEDFDESALCKKAARVMNQILNDYSAFHVETIDRFFQGIIRGFARESGLQAGFNLELNNLRILDEAIDLLMYSLDTDENLRTWLVNFAEHKIASGKDWNIQNDILQLGKEIFRESYQETSTGMDSVREKKEKITAYRNILQQELNIFENFMSGIGQQALKIIHGAGLSVDDFSYKSSGVAGYFNKIANKRSFDPQTRARKAMELPDKWLPAKSPRSNVILPLVEQELIPLLVKTVSYFDSNITRYNTSETILKNLFAFGILNDIYLKVREITGEQNLFLLSDANVFLKKIIAGNDAPFIYEKAGNYFHHFMLDEFQDTSRYQWNNFMPLISNSMAYGYTNIVVGDVKQAIYRWRNTDWKILASEVEDAFPEFEVGVNSLLTNWRSKRNIVAFNNSLFMASAALIQKRISENTLPDAEDDSFFSAWNDTVKEVYSKSLQRVAPGKIDSEGFIDVSFYEGGKDKFHEKLSAKLPLLIRDLLQRGYEQRDIAILVRKGSQGKAIAEILMEYSSLEDFKLNIISNDSLFIENHSSVRFLSALLKYLRNSSDAINTAFIRQEFLRYLSGTPEEKINTGKLFDNCREGNLMGLHECFDDFLDESNRLKRLPLLELTEELIGIFRMNEDADNIAFLQAFQDIVLDYTRNHSTDISSFIRWWEQNGRSQTLNVSEDQNAIKIMTIHKSKGLQFPVVIVPYCNWNLDIEPGKDNYLWCSNVIPPLDYIETVPVTYQSSLLHTNYRREYLEEKFRNYMDNLNLLYVAFTRPEDELYVLAHLDNKNSACSLVQEIITLEHKLTDIPPGFPVINLSKNYKEEGNQFIYGEKGKPVSERTLLPPEFISDYVIMKERGRLRLNVQNSKYLNKNDYTRKLGYGTVMHEILSDIETPSDIDAAVRKATSRGNIPSGESAGIVSFLKEKLNSEHAKEWFNGTWKLMREREMKGGGHEIIRPDRVMIKDSSLILVDYKFGEERYPVHERQMQKYLHVLKNMQYRDVKAYLWYLSMGKITEVR